MELIIVAIIVVVVVVAYIYCFLFVLKELERHINNVPFWATIIIAAFPVVMMFALLYPKGLAEVIKSIEGD